MRINRRVNRSGRHIRRFYRMVDKGELQKACEYGCMRRLGSDVVIPIAEILYDELIEQGMYAKAAQAVKYGIGADLAKRAEVLGLMATARQYDGKARHLIAEAKRMRALAEKLNRSLKEASVQEHQSAEELQRISQIGLEEREIAGMKEFEKAVADGRFMHAQHIAVTYLKHKPEYIRRARMFILEKALRNGEDAEVRCIMKEYGITPEDLQNAKKFIEKERELDQEAQQANNL